jgi:hypothetical protein
MRIDRLAIAASALVASTILISCGSDDDSTPANDTVGGAVVVDSTIGTDTSLSLDTSLGTDTTTP